MSNIERREHERVFTEGLFIGVKFDAASFGPVEPVMKINISKGGVAFLTDKNAEIGDKVFLDGTYKQARICSVPAIIVSKKKVGDIQRLNAQFDMSVMNELMKKEIDNLISAVS